jgi:hypothetical protein
MRWLTALVLAAIVLAPAASPADLSPTMPTVRKHRPLHPLHGRRTVRRSNEAGLEFKGKGGRNRNLVFRDRDGDGVPDKLEDDRLDRVDRLFEGEDN